MIAVGKPEGMTARYACRMLLPPEGCLPVLSGQCLPGDLFLDLVDDRWTEIEGFDVGMGHDQFNHLARRTTRLDGSRLKAANRPWPPAERYRQARPRK